MKDLKINDVFFLQYKDYVYTLLTDKGYDDKDLVHDVFEAALLHVDYFNNDFIGGVSNWLNQLVVHVIDRKKRSPDIMNTDPYEIDFSDDSTEALMVTDDDLITSRNDHYYNSNKEEVDLYINMLPENQRNVVYLRLVLGHSHDEISEKLTITLTNSRTIFERGTTNLKKLLNSDNPDKEVLKDTNILKPYGDKAYSGEWNWRPNESPDRSPGKVKIFSRDEIIAYCQERNLNYAN